MAARKRPGARATGQSVNGVNTVHPGMVHPAAEDAVLEAAVRRVVADSGVTPDMLAPRITRTRLKEILAVEGVKLLPAIPTASAGITKEQYRKVAAEALNLAAGGEGLFANFVEQMTESIAQGFENRLGSQNLGEEDGDGEGEGGDGKPAPKTTPNSKNAPKRENFVGIFNTFCRQVNADPDTGMSIAGRVRGMDDIHQQFTWHYWTTGLQVWLLRWGQVAVPELKYRKVQVPVEMELLDPLKVDLDMFRTLGIVYFEMDKAVIDKLKKEVEALGDPALHPFFAMYPAEADRSDPNLPQNIFSAQEAYAEMNAKKRIPLPPDAIKVVTTTFNRTATYPVPFAARIFTSVNDKRMLRGMDRALIRKVIMMILQVALASPDQKRAIREPDLEKTRDRIQEQLESDNEYLQILTTTENTKIQWIQPEQGAIFDREKYRCVDFEILSSLVGLVSNQLLSNSGSLDMTLIGKQLFQKNQVCLKRFQRFLEEIYDEIIFRNKLRAIKPSDVNVVFKQISLFESEQFKTFIYNMVVKGVMPVKMAIQHLGEDFDTVIEDLVKEEQLRQKYNILKVLPTNVQESDSGPTKNSGPGGRPPGSTDTEDRTTEN